MNLETAISSVATGPGLDAGMLEGSDSRRAGSRGEGWKRADVTRNDGARTVEKNESGGKARVEGRWWIGAPPSVPPPLPSPPPPAPARAPPSSAPPPFRFALPGVEKPRNITHSPATLPSSSSSVLLSPFFYFFPSAYCICSKLFKPPPR